MMTTVTDQLSREEVIRLLLRDVAEVDACELTPSADLYTAGLSSLATVDLMLAIEDHFEIEFTSEWLNRRTFSSIAALGKAVRTLQEDAP